MYKVFNGRVFTFGFNLRGPGFEIWEALLTLSYVCCAIPGLTWRILPSQDRTTAPISLRIIDGVISHFSIRQAVCSKKGGEAFQSQRPPGYLREV